MPERPDEFAVLMRGLDAGSPEAAQEVIRRYGPHILRVVRRRLHHKLRPKFDSIDFTQDVWKSFFGDPARPRAFAQPEALVAFLATMAEHKVIDAFRQRLQTQKYDVDRECSLESFAGEDCEALIDPRPSPSQVMVAKEQFDQMVDGRVPSQQAILVLLQNGATHREIAAKLGLNEKTVQRLLRRVAPEPAP
jgi:RNA polymerase sigma factor (sigma-70 family)